MKERRKNPAYLHTYEALCVAASLIRCFTLAGEGEEDERRTRGRRKREKCSLHERSERERQ